MQARNAAAYARRVTAALAFWLAAVLFVIDVSILSGWLPTSVAVAAPEPAPTATEPSEAVASDMPTQAPLTEASGIDVALDGGATITFPLSPVQTQEIHDFDGEEATLVKHAATAADETTYNASVIDYPPTVNVSDPAVNLIASVSGAAGSTGGRVVAQEVTLYDGAPAVEFTLEVPGNTLLARYVLDGSRMYQTSVAFVAGADPSDAETFLDSLDLPD